MTASPPIPPADLEALDALYARTRRSVATVAERYERKYAYEQAVAKAFPLLSVELKRLRAERAELKAEFDQLQNQWCNGQIKAALGNMEEFSELRAEVDRLRTELGAATGYMENARIELGVGTKAKAIAILLDGLKRARSALSKLQGVTDNAV